MQVFTVDARDGYQNTDCNTCCCADANARAGETNLFRINYAPWSSMIAGKGLADYANVEFEYKPSGYVNANAPTNEDYNADTLMNMPITGNVSDDAIAPNNEALFFKHMTLFGPENGSIEWAENGDYTYTPNENWWGYDHIYFKTSDGTNEIVNVLTIAVSQVGNPLPVAPTQDVVSVLDNRMRVEGHSLHFPLQVLPNAKAGDIYRMTVRMPARDCDCNLFYHVSCYDILIGKCR